jgi:hypothetical protein
MTPRTPVPQPPASSTLGADAVEILRVWTSDAGEQVVLRVDTLDPAAWGIILVDIAKHVAHAYARQGKCTANEAFAQVLHGLIAELGHATDAPQAASNASPQ